MCYVFKKFSLATGNRIPQFRFIVDEAGFDMTAGDAIQKIMARAKESGAEVLTSEATRVLRGYPIRGLVPTAQALQPLQIGSTSSIRRPTTERSGSSTERRRRSSMFPRRFWARSIR